MKTKKFFTSVVFRGEKMWVARCVELGVVSQGKTPFEAKKNLQEAVELYLEEMEETPAFFQNPKIETFSTTLA